MQSPPPERPGAARQGFQRRGAPGLVLCRCAALSGDPPSPAMHVNRYRGGLQGPEDGARTQRQEGS